MGFIEMDERRLRRSLKRLLDEVETGLLRSNSLQMMIMMLFI